MFTDSRINIFMEVVREGSFTGAAKKLGISQPAVSQNIAEIEKEIAAQLFERKRGEVKLTKDGERFLSYAEQILYWYSAASKEFGKKLPSTLLIGRKEPRELRIGISEDYRCFLVPTGSEGVDIDIDSLDGGMSVKVIQKKAEPKGPADELF